MHGRVKDLYAELGVSKQASTDDLKKAYRALVKELHPDRNPDNPQAEERFKSVSAAYAVLKDPQKRSMYDQFGEAALQDGFDPNYARPQRGGGSKFNQGFQSFNFGDFNLEDLLRSADLQDMFGGAGASSSGGVGVDFRSTISITFVESLRGTERELTFSEPGGGDRTVRVRIPKGVRDGETIRLRGQGGPGPAGAGDLLLKVAVAPHPNYWREQNDLHVRATISLIEAYEGTSFAVDTVSGAVRLKVPPGSQPGSKLRIPGKGIARGKAPGDVIVHVQVQLPPPGDPEVADHLRAASGQDSTQPASPVRL